MLGAGRTELLEALFGASAANPSGTIELDGQSVQIRSPAEAIAHGLALVTEDRKNLGIFDQMNVGQNTSICRLDHLTKAGLVSHPEPSERPSPSKSSSSGSKPPEAGPPSPVFQAETSKSAFWAAGC